MDIAERNGPALRRALASAESLSDCAIALGSFQVKTPFSRLSALLSRVTLADHLLFDTEPGFSTIVRSQFDIRDLPVLCFKNQLFANERGEVFQQFGNQINLTISFLSK